MFTGGAPYQSPPGGAEVDLQTMIRQMQVQMDDMAVQHQRQLTETQQDNARLRDLLNEQVSRQDSRIDSLLSSRSDTSQSTPSPWQDQDWAYSYGGSPRPQSTPAPQNREPENLDAVIEQKLEQRERERQQKAMQSEQQRKAEAARLWRKFEANFPQYASDPLMVTRLKANWQAASELNNRAPADSRLGPDELYNNVVGHLIHTKQQEDALVSQQYQQQYQQVQPAGPNAMRQPGQQEYQPFGSQFQPAYAQPGYAAPQQQYAPQVPQYAPVQGMPQLPAAPPPGGAQPQWGGAQKVPATQYAMPIPGKEAQTTMPYAQGTPMAPSQGAQQGQANAFFGDLSERMMQRQQQLARRPVSPL